MKLLVKAIEYNIVYSYSFGCGRTAVKRPKNRRLERQVYQSYQRVKETKATKENEKNFAEK